MSTAYPIPTLIAQSASPLYNLCHDLLLYFKGQSQDIRDLKERITKLTIDLTLMNSGKERIDRFLRHSVSAEESHAFKVMEVEIKVIHRKYTKFINKYTKMTKTQLVSTTDPPDVFSIDRLDDLKSKIMTFNFFKLAKLSRDVVKLNRRASEALGRLKVDDMTHKKERLNQVKFNDDDVLEMFDPYVDEVLEYLLHWYDGKKYVMMPPDFRRVASKLDYPNEKKCAVWVPSEHKNPDDDTWTRVTRMSLIGCKMELPQSPNCCNLYTLLLESMKQESTRIPGLFFTHMKSLQVLGLNQTNIGGLPESIKELVNLKSLYLNGCQNLIALPSGAADLVKLEFLDMCGTSIPTLPGEIRSMVRMRCLRASLSPKGKSVEEIIAPNIISNLKNLEELSIVTTFDIEIASAERLAKELASLEHLNTLCFNFPNLSSLNTFVTQSKALNNMDTSWREHTFRSFKIFIGCHETRHSHKQDFSNILSESERWLRYSTNEVFSPDCQKLLNQASAFEIIGQDGLKSFTSSQFDLRSIKVCVVEGCKYMKNIIDGYIANEAQGFVNVSLLKSLENLYLYDLESLECICDGPVPSTTLSNLTAITINGCHKLTEVLHPALTCSLKSLEYLKVSNCGKISKIIETRGETSETGQELSNSDLLRSLRKIEMTNLPELESIFGSSCSSNISWNSLRSIIIMRCNKLSNLCLTLTNAKKLASIRCEESWWDTSIPHEVKQHFLSVCSFWDESVEGGAQPRGQASTILRHQE